MKTCNQCKEKKELFDFYKSKTNVGGYSKICKKCNSNKYYTKHPNKKICRICKIKITSEIGINSGLKRKDNSIIYMSICKECIKPIRNTQAKNRRKNNINVRLYESIKSRINGALKIKHNKTNTNEYLGCNIDDYKTYLEKLFTLEMNWENYGKYWEIDHIIPLSKGGSFHYTNTQPLTINENRTKSNKI
jgi:5-methylcytosine-specific restriction endonuclease McrA